MGAELAQLDFPAHAGSLAALKLSRRAAQKELIDFLEHARKRDRVWFSTGRSIAEHWRKLYPPAWLWTTD